VREELRRLFKPSVSAFAPGSASPHTMPVWRKTAHSST